MQEDDCDYQSTALIRVAPQRRRWVILALPVVAVVALCVAAAAVRSPPPATERLLEKCTPPARNASSIDVYFGNGCFWERQWAYFNVETMKFKRPASEVTSMVGYAGGKAPPVDAPTHSVCYHVGDARDYTPLGHAEVTRITLDSERAEAQMADLARDYFDSFSGPAGDRNRPDPADAGSPYRSLVGLPGGTASPFYGVFAAANTHGMTLTASSLGGDADKQNTVWVMDSTAFPFWEGEVYHQFHCDFRMTAGMPYPKTYWQGVWESQKATCRIAPTGCPEEDPPTPHPGISCSQ